MTFCLTLHPRSMYTELKGFSFTLSKKRPSLLNTSWVFVSYLTSFFQLSNRFIEKIESSTAAPYISWFKSFACGHKQRYMAKVCWHSSLFWKIADEEGKEAQPPFKQFSSDSSSENVSSNHTHMIPFLDHKKGEVIFINHMSILIMKNRNDRSTINRAKIRDKTAEQHTYSWLGTRLVSYSVILRKITKTTI